ncbi:MAG: phosphoribosylanthranilate isomerase [Armatimonadetes bacterium]|nr:phosphoribosylanthranilate isomerase [Armatimonadota bacterium]
MTRVKICGLTRVEDVELAVELGAAAVGFVLEPSSPRCIPLADVHDLLRSTPPYTYCVAVLGPFVHSKLLAPFDAVQAIGVSNADVEASQRAIHVCRIGSDDPLPEPASYDALLLDAFSPEAYGGTGVRIDLDAARGVMAESVRPVILAGGMTPDNVGEVIRTLRPYAVDVSSGVESSPGVKDTHKLRAFFEAVRETDTL